MSYVSKRKPREHQVIAAKKAKGKKAFALLMAMRVGKSKVIVDEFGEAVYNGKLSDLLVIAPGGVYRTWEGALLEDLPQEVFEQLQIFVWKSGSYSSKAGKLRLKEFLDFTGPRALLMNIEALSSVDLARDLAKKFLLRGRNIMITDESTALKNPSALRTRFIIRELKPLSDYRRILSGLPTPRSPLDLYSQFEFLDPRILGFNSYYAFRARYAIMQKMDFGGRIVPIVVGYRDVDELQKKIAPYSYRVRLEDCYDLPPSQYSVREVELTKEQERMYQELKLFATAKISGEQFVTATIVITQILRLHQLLCGHTRDEKGGWHAIPEKRTEALLELLEDYDGKAIVWCSYDADIRKVSEALQKAFNEKRIRGFGQEFTSGCVARFWGGNRATREEEEKRFKIDPECRFMVATPDAGGKARTWSVADLVVFYSSTNNLENRDQAEARPLGVNKTTSIQYVDLQVPGTVEEKIIKALRAKIDMASAITGDNYRDWLV